MTGVTQWSAENLIREAGVDPAKWNRMPGEQDILETIKNIESHGMKVIRAANGTEAVEHIRQLVPPGAEVMAGSSTTLVEIGFDDLVKSKNSGWNLLHLKITAENDDKKRAELRRKSVCADYFLSSANAISRTGELVGWDATGSRTGAWIFAAGHLIIVAGVNKIVPTLDDALCRVKEYCYPLENARATHAYGIGSVQGKGVILAYERIPGRTTVILVNENLGY